MPTLGRKPKMFGTAVVVDEALVADQRPAIGQSAVGLAEQLELLLEAPVVQDLAHDKDLRRRQRAGEESPG
jgi:hypothetical protein